MASTQVTPTRMELTKQKKKLVTATRGHKLLKDKRDELMRQFLEMVRENMALREKVEAGIKSANKNFVIAKAGMSEEILRVALMAPKQEVYLETSTKNVMSVDIPVFEYKTRTADTNDIYSYGFAFTSSDLDDAVKSLADILPDMLLLAEREKACQLMASEIEKTRRRVNALEHVIIPQAQSNIKYITMKLDENERSTQIRLMKVKDMMLEEKHHYKEKQQQRQAQEQERGRIQGIRRGRSSINLRAFTDGEELEGEMQGADDATRIAMEIMAANGNTMDLLV